MTERSSRNTSTHKGVEKIEVSERQSERVITLHMDGVQLYRNFKQFVAYRPRVHIFSPTGVSFLHCPSLLLSFPISIFFYKALKMTIAMYPLWYMYIKCLSSYVISKPKPSPMMQCHGDPNFLSIWSFTNLAAIS